MSVSISIPPISADFSEWGAAAKPPNLRISASGNTQYELTQSINSPWARRFTLDPMGLAALNPPMGSSPLRVGRCFCGVTAKVATGDPHPLTPTGRCTPVPSTKGLQPSVLPPEKADCQKHSQSAFPVFEESSLVAFFKKKTDAFLFTKNTSVLLINFIVYCCSGFIPTNSGSLAATHRGTGTFSPSLQTLQQSSHLGFL